MTIPRRIARPGLWWAAVGLAAVATVLGVALATGVLSEEHATMASNLAYPPIVFGAAAIILVGARGCSARDRLAWSLVGASLVAQGIGEVLWGYYEVGLKVEVPYPGIPDLFYLLVYPLLAAGILLMPRVGSTRSERIRATLDAAAGTLAVGLVGWYVVLLPIYREAQGSSIGELLLGMAYPFGDIILLSAVLVLSTRRGAYVRDTRLTTLSVGLVVFTIADLVYVAQSWFGAYESGSWVDALWLPAFVFFAFSGAGLARRFAPRDVTDRVPSVWQRSVPYAAVSVLALLFLWILFAEAGDVSSVVFKAGTLIVGGLVGVRQYVTLTETRARLRGEQKRLVSVISHELRTPLTGVQGFLQVLTSEWESLAETERLDMVILAEEQSRHIGRIVSDLVQVSKGKLHDVELRREPVPVADLVAQVTGLVEGLDRSSVSTDVQPHLVALADRERFAQILSNLLTNAVRYGNGHTHVLAGQEGEMARIEVHDNGSGVPTRYQHLIWDRFERGANRTNGQVSGSGLGLAVVRSLVAAHGGTIDYRPSALLGGACFSFTMPVAPVLREEPVAAGR